MSKFLSKQLREQIITYVDKELISRDDTFDLWKANNEEELILTLSKILKVCEEEKDKLWLHIIENYWKTIDDVFGKNEIMFLKTIIKYNGIVSREEILKNIKIFKNTYSINVAVEELIDYKVIDKIQLTNSKVLYVISLEILKCVRGVKNE